jgi:hypothetical protein
LNILQSLANEARKKKDQLVHDIAQAPAAVAHTVIPAATHNPVTNVIGHNVVQPAVHFMENGGLIGMHHPGYQQFSRGLSHGLERSAVGTGQALSGLYDMASQRTLAPRPTAFDRGLDTAAKGIDNVVKQQHVNPLLYKASQAGGDLAQFAIGSGELKAGAKALTTIPKVGGAFKGTGKALSLTEKPAQAIKNATKGGNIGQRIIGKTAGNVLSPKYQAVNAAFTAGQEGKNASHGQAVTKKSAAMDLAMGGLAFPAAGAVGSEVVAPLGRAAAPLIKNGAKAGTKAYASGRGKLATNAGIDKEIIQRNNAIKSLKQRQAKTTPGSVASENHQRAIDVHQAVIDRLSSSRQKLTIPERLANQNVGNTIGGPNALQYQLAKKQGKVFPGVDGKPRFEIDDSGAKLQDFNGSTLGEVIHHPELYKQYPALKNIGINRKPLSSSERASFDGRNITINEEMSPERAKNSILHEVQHAIQDKENFAKGGSPTDFSNLVDTFMEHAPRLKELEAKPWQSLSHQEKVEMVNLQDMREKAHGMIKNGTDDPHDQYHKLAGEAEARAVEARANLTDKQRYVKSEPSYKQLDQQAIHKQPNLTNKQLESLSPEAIDGLKQQGYKGVSNGKRTVRFDETPAIHPEIAKLADSQGMVTVHRGGDVSADTLKNLRYGDYVSSARGSTDGVGNAGASAYGKNVVTLKVPAKDLKYTNGELQFIGASKSLQGKKYPESIYRAYNDVNGSNFTAKEIDEMSPTMVRDEASQGLEGGSSEYDELLSSHGKPATASKPTPKSQPATSLRSTFYDSLDVPKDQLIIRHDGGTAMSISKAEKEAYLQAKKKVADDFAAAEAQDKNPTAPVSSATPKSAQPKPAAKRQSVASRGTGGGSLPKNTPIKVKGAMSAEDYKARFGKDKPVDTVKVAPFTKPQIDFKKWNDKNALGLGRETMERNLDRIAGKDAPAMKHLLVDSSRQNETARVQFANHLRQDTRQTIVKDLGIKAGSNESALVQKYGEGIATKEDIINEVGQAKADRIIQASDHFRKQYDQLIDQWNVTRKKYGFDPIPKRKDYFRHFQAIDQNASILGTIKNARDLPTEISGITDIFNPNKPFSDAALQRKGNKTTYDAVGGFDNYINSVSRQIFHTDTVQKGRAIEKAIRKQAAGNPTLELPNFVANLHEWTNVVSGKKTRIDRAAEELVGRKVYAAANAIRSKTGANMIGANVGSALTNFIPFTQAAATTGKSAMLKAVTDTLQSPFSKSYHAVDGQVSSFLTRRFPDEAISFTKLQNVSHAASLPFKAVDTFTSRTIVAGKYFEGKAKGMSPKEAMKAADDYASRVITDRSVGQMPNLMETKTAGFLAQFQAEVNNQVSFLARDIPQFANGNKTKIASSLVQFALYSYLANEASQHILGRRVQLDPVHAVATIANPKNNNQQRVDALKNDIAGGLPFTSVFTGGRLPVNAMLPDVPSIGKGIGDLSSDKNKAAREIYKGVSGPLFYGVPPFGGGQLKKTAEYAQNMMKGYSETPAGTKRFDIAKDSLNTAKGLAFGQYSTTPGQQYIQNLKAGTKTSTTSAGSTTKSGDITKDPKAMATAFGKQFASLKNDTDRKAWADQSPDNKAIYNEYNAMHTATKAAPELPDGISPDSAKTLTKDSHLTANGKMKAQYSQNDYDYKLAQAKYEADKLNGKLSMTEDIKRQNELAKAHIGSQYSKDVRDLYSLNKSDLYSLLTSDPNGKMYADQLKAYDGALLNHGIISTAKFKNGFNTSKDSGGSKKSLSTLLAEFKLPGTEDIKNRSKAASLARNAKLAKKRA